MAKKLPRSPAMSDQPKPEEPVVPARQPKDEPPPFPPRREFSSLALEDLLDARDAYHVHLSNLPNVVATAVGRYLIRADDWYATHPPDEPRPAAHKKNDAPRTLGNSIIRSWSWPCVLVFVRDWNDRRRLGDQAIPRRLYLPDGRQVPTCRVLGTPDETPPPPVAGAAYASELLGGGYRCERHAQGVIEVGTLGCLVQREGTYYALTNRHVAGTTAGEVFALVRGETRRIGISDGAAIEKQALKSLFPDFGASHVFVNLDAGLVRLDDVSNWTSQVFGIGEVGEVFDATASTLTLDLLGLPVRAFGGTSGVLEGEIKALFFRYQSLGDYDYVSDVLIGPRTQKPAPDPRRPAPPSAETQPGDSGTIWFYDPPATAPPPRRGPQLHPADPPARGLNARRLRPLAMQWGGQRVALPDGKKSAFALATFVSTICRTLDVEIVRSWSTGHDEYWGKLGHFAVGWKACGLLTGALSTLMLANQTSIGFGNDKLGKGAAFKMGRGGFVPLADVPDYVWIAAAKFVKQRNAEPGQHFADIDIKAIDGGPSMLEACRKDPKKLVPSVWRDYFGGFAAAGVGPDMGALPFRVWQLFDLMVKALKAKDVKTFVGLGGVMAHYVGDASQPLHTSYLHHGRLPMVTKPKGKFPVAHDSPEYAAYKATSPAKVHGIYEEQMLEVDTPAALQAIDAALKNATVKDDVKTGWGAARATFDLMSDAHTRLPPETIIDADDPSLPDKDRAKRLWANAKVKSETIRSLAASTTTLARLWASAWTQGNGKAVPASKLKVFTEKEFTSLVKTKTFAPALTLDEMAKSGDFVAH